MDFNVENLISDRALQAIRDAGLHKVAGVLAGVDELTLKEAVNILGRKAYTRRKEAGQVAAGIAALAELRGEKLAFQELLRRSIAPAVAGAGLAMIPDLMGDAPFNPNQALQHAAAGGLAGGIAGAANTMALGRRQNPQAWGDLMHSVSQVPRAFG